MRYEVIYAGTLVRGGDSGFFDGGYYDSLSEAVKKADHYKYDQLAHGDAVVVDTYDNHRVVHRA